MTSWSSAGRGVRKARRRGDAHNLRGLKSEYVFELSHPENARLHVNIHRIHHVLA